MAWLVTHMWMALTAAAVFALLLGWTLRGILVTGKLRKAVVDKDIALTELDQARDEIERLFAAQRAQKGEGGAVADVSERKITDLTAELQKAKTELATLKSAAAKASSPVAPAAGSADEGHTPTIVLPPSRAGSDNGASEPAAAETPAEAEPAAGGEAEESPSLVWRNRHLESRVNRLEEQLAKAIASLAAATPAAPAEAAETVPTVDEEGVAKLKWQADYLKQRVEALETELANAPAEAAAPAEETSEEMARLRWRNRFLEGRLAYFEGGSEEAAQMTGAEAMLEQLEVADTAADMTEAVAAMAEEDTAAEGAMETVVEEEPAPEGEEAFADVPDDEEESLAEADHADEDVLTDEEYSEEDFTSADAEDDIAEEFGDEAAAEDIDDEEPVDAAEEDFDADDDEADEIDDDADQDGFDDEEGDLEEDEADFDGDGEAYDEADDEDDDEDEYFDESDEDEDESDDHEAYDEVDDVEDEAFDDEEDAGIDEDGAGETDEVEYEPGDEIVAERPMAMDGPVEGHPDDLTMIGGIGPKIQVLLNELGIWHYDQIAAWSPENVAWVDEHLNFNGRIAREGWVGQAAVLVADEENV